MKLEQIASLISGTLAGDGSIEINGVRGVKDAKEGDITFLGSGKYLDNLITKSMLIMQIINKTLNLDKYNQLKTEAATFKWFKKNSLKILAIPHKNR